MWEYDYVDDDSDPSGHSHGTQTVSIACGYAPGKLIGPAYNAKVMFAKTQLEAEEQLMETREKPILREWEK